MEIVVERFKNIERIELDVSGLSLLVGGNNAGKSSVLQAIQFGISVAQTSLFQGGAWMDDRLSTSIGQSDLVYSPIKDVLSLARNGRLREPEAEAIRVTYRDGGNETRVTVRKGRNKNILLEIVGRTLGEILQSIQMPYCALVTGLAGIPSEEEFETSIVVRKAAAKGDSNSVFRNILLQLKQHREKWSRFLEQISRLFPDYVIDVNFDPNVDETINCSVSKAGVVYPIDTCGTGILQAVQIFSYINLFSPHLLLLDEPDSHLHPNNQKQLARELVAASEGGLSIIVSTHSKHLVEALNEHSRLIWLGNGSKQANVDDYEVKALLEIGALNVGERLGNPNYIVLTEDSNHSTIEILLEANGHDLDDTEIISYSGCTQIGTALTLINHLRKTRPAARYAIHRDKDFLAQEDLDRYIDHFRAMNVVVFLPSGNDIESHFLSLAHLGAACDVDEPTARDILAEAFESRRFEMVSKYVSTRCENERRRGVRPHEGDISAECLRLMTGPESAAVHGKTLLKGVRDALRRRGIADRLISNSAALRTESLVHMWAIVPQAPGDQNP